MRAITALNWKRFFIGLYDRSFDADIFSRAAQIAFYFSFAVFPLLYFLVSLFGLVLDSSEGLRRELFSYLRQILPFSVYDLVRKTVDEIVENSTGGKLTIGLLVTLWSASAGVDGIRSALNAVYDLKESRTIWKTRMQSVLYTLVIALLTGAVLALVFYGWQLVEYAVAGMGLRVTSPLVLVSIQWIAMLGIMLFACEVIYNLLPDFKAWHWAWITPGSIVAILLWILLTSAFRLYLSYFNSYNKAYGSLGAMIILMLWLYLTACALMVGGAINAVWGKLRNSEETFEEA